MWGATNLQLPQTCKLLCPWIDCYVAGQTVGGLDRANHKRRKSFVTQDTGSAKSFCTISKWTITYQANMRFANWQSTVPKSSTGTVLTSQLVIDLSVGHFVQILLGGFKNARWRMLATMQEKLLKTANRMRAERVWAIRQLAVRKFRCPNCISGAAKLPLRGSSGEAHWNILATRRERHIYVLWQPRDKSAASTLCGHETKALQLGFAGTRQERHVDAFWPRDERAAFTLCWH